MTIANPVNFYDNFVFGSYTGDNGAGHWDGYSETYSTNIFGGILQGGFLNWGGFDMLTTAGGTSEIPYSGYASNWGGLSMQSLGSNTETPYIGYSSNWGKTPISTNLALDVVDINSVIDHPKDQTIYYKLKGWNPLTSTYEVWVISENITGRPELFDPVPGRTPPNTERDIYKTPPSGNSLTNIVIVARWIQ